MSSANYGTILYVAAGTDIAFLRSKVNGVWKDWVRLMSSADMQSGVITVDAAANGATEFTVTFPVAFANLPCIVVGVLTSRPDLRQASPVSRTNTGFVGTLYNGSTAGKLNVFWIATN